MAESKRPIRFRASAARPCPVCGEGSKGCSATDDGMHLCRGTARTGWVRLTRDPDPAGFHHYREGDTQPAGPSWGDRARAFAAALDRRRKAELAAALGLPVTALAALPLIGWSEEDPFGPCWTFPEEDGAGRVIGLNRRRAADGAKRALSGAARGLTVPEGFGLRGGPVLVVEGASDVLALDLCGLTAVGRPGAAAGFDHLAALLAGLDPDRPVYVLGENDARPDRLRPGETKWPGKEGVDALAPRLAAKLGRPVRTAFPPDDLKDCRAWVLDGAAGQAEAVDWAAIGLAVLDHLAATAEPVDPPPSLVAAAAARDSLEVTAAPWPDPLGAAAYHGLAGAVVRAIDPHTEADPVAILAQFLVAFGNMVGRHAFYQVESSRHFPNLFCVLVGQSSRARKGTSWQRARSVLERGGDEEWARARIVSGLSSGEGLIWEVRDSVVRRQPVRDRGRTTGHETVEVDPGVEDKRVLVVEEEFASVLAVGKREGNILGSVLRSAWDTGRLGSLTKNSPARATGAHVSIISHITQTELIESVHATQAHNGFLNRFLWFAVRRSKLLPFGGLEEDMTDLAAQLDTAYRLAAGGERRLDLSDVARRLWAAEYPRLTADRPGLAGAVTSRSEAQTIRLALVYALLDQAPAIDEEHLRAALAVERYVEESARHVFGDATGDPLADEIRDLLRAAAPKGITQGQIVDHFDRHRTRAELEKAMTQLVRAGLARSEKTPTGGRPTVTWFACEKSELSEESPPG